MKHECCIGILSHYEWQELVTLSDLLEDIKQNEHNHMVREGFLEYKHREPFTLKDYTDFRKSTNLERFRFCPFCGEKIDWKAIKEHKNET